MNSILREAYFLIIYTDDDRLVSYCEVSYFCSEASLLDYLKAEFRGTDAEEIANYTVLQLIEGVSYQQSHRMGCGATTTYVQVIHESNLGVLYRLLDSAEIEDEDGKRLRLSSYLKTAECREDIEEVIMAFNESCDNCW